MTSCDDAVRLSYNIANVFFSQTERVRSVCLSVCVDVLSTKVLTRFGIRFGVRGLH